MKNKKVKLYLVPHTHWDREWYFSKDTGDVLLNHMINDLFHLGENSPMMLDGQFSLIDDYILTNPNRKNQIIKLFKNKMISSGPFYTQPDVFNSSGETTIRNIEIGQKMSKEFGTEFLKTAYLPDTFGFNPNLPQIFKLKNLDNFVFWRGPSEELANNTAYFIWEGLDGSRVNSYNFKDGYYQLGMYYPYNSFEMKKYNKTTKKLAEGIKKQADKISLPKDLKLLPLGGDQAPYLHDAKNKIKMINKMQNDYEIYLFSNYDKFFEDAKKPKIIYKGDLRTPFTGKIHRTISSSRYDIKKSFRDAENKLYYLLEPLEIFYSTLDKNYDFESYKERHIIKPLLVGQTHDSLGGCNTDYTNSLALLRTTRIQDTIMSQVDLLMKKIINNNNVKEENIIIFNPQIEKSNIFERKIIYSSINKKTDIKTNGFSIYTISSKNISLSKDKFLYEKNVIIYKSNLKPQQISIIDLKQHPNHEFKKEKPINIKINDNFIEMKIKDQKFKLFFKAIGNGGDGYDFSPQEKLILNQNHKLIDVVKIHNDQFYVYINSIMKLKNTTSEVNWDILINQKTNKIRANFKIKNNFKNVRISLQLNKVYNKILKSQHLAITEFVKNDFIKDWKNKYHEYPVHVDQNDGLIALDKLNIMTSGTNEFFKNKNGVEIILYRANSLVTGKNLKWRPTTSGLNFIMPSPAANLNKTLYFELEFNIGKKQQVLNQWKYQPYSYKVQSGNFIANKMSKFVINDITKKYQNKKIDIKLSNKDIFISSIRRCESDVLIRIVNMDNKIQKTLLIFNNKQKELNFKKYEIKEEIIKGVF